MAVLHGEPVGQRVVLDLLGSVKKVAQFFRLWSARAWGRVSGRALTQSWSLTVALNLKRSVPSLFSMS